MDDVNKVSRQSNLVKIMLLRKWKRARAILGTKAGLKQVHEECNKGLTLLGIAASCDPPPDIVRHLLKVEPLHSLKVDSYGMLPLHIACMNGASLETIKLILDHDGGACAQAIDMMKKAPLHYAVQYVCEPFRKDLDIAAFTSLHSLSTSKDQNLQVSGRSKSRRSSRRSDECSTMTMSQDRFQEQMQVIKILTEASPEIVHFADCNDNTPIDILQECKAEFKEGSKWERADICCEILRKVAIREYREQKLVYEMQGYNNQYLSANLSQASSHSRSNTSRSDGSTKNTSVSGTSNISRLEVDATSYSQMDLSVGDDGTEAKQEDWKMKRPSLRQQVVKEESLLEDMDIDMDM